MGLYRLFFTLLVVVVVVLMMPLTVVLAQEANPTRVLPVAVEKGATFNVTVNFTAPRDNFRLVSFSDLAPDGWNVTVSKTWCTPTPTTVKATGNKAEIMWGGSFSNGTSFSVLYKVTVPDDAEAGFHTFSGYIEYYFGTGGPYGENIAGDSQVLLLIGLELDVIRCINETLTSPNMLYPGDTFEVFVNWTAPLRDFCAIGLTDLAPAGFEVEANETWCSPTANETKAAGNKVEILWYGPYNNGTNFTARYKVTVSQATAPGSHYFPCDNCSLSWLNYSFGEFGPYTSCIMGDSEVVVTVPGDIGGETFDVNHNELSDVDVALYLDGAGWLRSDASTPNYTHTVNITGEYWLVASKARYYDINIIDMPHLEDRYINLTTLELLAAGYAFDFEGNYGLVPRACNMSYALESVNLWLYWPIDHPEWGLSVWKAMQSVNSWQNPS